MSNPFRRIDTVILRVRDLRTALSWYTDFFAVEPSYHDDDAGLAVLELGPSGSVTLWQLAPDEPAPHPNGRSGTYPIFAVDDIEAARSHACERASHVEDVQSGAGVQYFGFHDPDGNYLEACHVL